MKLTITEKDLDKIVGKFIIQLNTGDNQTQYINNGNCNLDFYLHKRIYFIMWGIKIDTVIKSDLFGNTFEMPTSKFLDFFNEYKFDDESGKRYHRLLTSRELDIVFKFIKERNY
jgi:hypothetical protein